ncbi:hypothetical protein ACJX0J_023678, partial [Zea mays]
MTTAISIEDVRREVKILKALSGHSNLVKFYDACEDALNVYIIMELCEGGELLDRILSRGGRYNEGDAKIIVEQILKVVAFCHLQGVVHRDLKPENFLFSTREEHSPMKIIDFGLSDFIRPDERLNDIVGSAYYVAPEVLHRSYSTEADMWSIGVITYILLCGSRPFWARTESGIFRSVLRADPNFEDSPWQSVSPEAKDFVKRLLNKDYRKRMTAAQALSHPWLRDEQQQIPLDMLVFKLVKAYLVSTPLKRAALKALSRAITQDELIYIRAQYNLLEPNSADGRICIDNFRMALLQNCTDAMKESRTLEILHALEPLAYRRMDFEEFRAATISPYQLEAVPRWEEIASTAFGYFEQEGNRAITIEELAQREGVLEKGGKKGNQKRKGHVLLLGHATWNGAAVLMKLKAYLNAKGTFAFEPVGGLFSSFKDAHIISRKKNINGNNLLNAFNIIFVAFMLFVSYVFITYIKIRDIKCTAHIIKGSDTPMLAETTGKTNTTHIFTNKIKYVCAANNKFFWNVL